MISYSIIVCNYCYNYISRLLGTKSKYEVLIMCWLENYRKAITNYKRAVKTTSQPKYLTNSQGCMCRTFCSVKLESFKVPRWSIIPLTPWSHRTAKTPDTVKIMRTFLLYSYKSLNFPTKWYTKLVIWLIHSWEIFFF